ncbi:MAG: hypothetical protein E7580_06645 [Ruminococcaceae bacterium]|nr:hypothetical protein [Oscillospiraceae bacterium]
MGTFNKLKQHKGDYCECCNKKLPKHMLRSVCNHSFCKQCESIIIGILMQDSEVHRVGIESVHLIAIFDSVIENNNKSKNLIFMHDGLMGIYKSEHETFRVCKGSYDGSEYKPDSILGRFSRSTHIAETHIAKDLIHNISYNEFSFLMRAWYEYLTKENAEEVIAAAWDKMRELSLNEMVSDEFTILFDYNLDGFWYAKDVWGTQYAYIVSFPLSNGRRIIREGNVETVDGQLKFKELCGISLCFEELSTEQDAKEYFSNHFDRFVKGNKYRRRITVYSADYGHRGHVYSTITVKAPDLSTNTCLIHLDTHEAELCPYPQGYFEGYTFQKEIVASIEEYNWSDEQLKEKYEPMFDKRR